MTANILTVVFLYGLIQAFKVYRDEDAKPGTLLCLAIPLLVLAAGFFIYG
jgi:hypothetical protein